MDKKEIFQALGLEEEMSGLSFGPSFKEPGGEWLVSVNPTNGEELGKVKMASLDDYERVMKETLDIWPKWAMTPAPKRGMIVREIGEELRKYKEPLGRLVSLEMGKILQEGLGEVQEMIDIADFAVGLSRQLYGLTIASERPRHRMMEQWHPLGPIGIFTAFNFPVAVWAWNAMIAAVCGDTMVWKPSPHVPFCALAVQKICSRVLERNGFPKGIMNLVIGPVDPVAEAMLQDKRLPLISFTGSCQIGKIVAQKVAARLGRTILELGGNNGIILLEDCDLDLALRAVLFAAVGTAGQRCTTARRIIIQRPIFQKFTELLINAYKQVKIGDPLDPSTLMGPLITRSALERAQKALEKAKEEGGEILYGGNILTEGPYSKGHFMEPTIVKAHKDMTILQEETFAPILYLLECEDLDEALAIHNSVPQGLSSAIFTNHLRHAETFLSPLGSDCGIANVNIGTSGAEIGGAFGGEKETGGGREAGSDAWKAYMRRQTVTINYSTELPLAQGIQFGTDS
ncbi:MAG: aldehyde dehydrogenase family protein [Planctomycetota bacterium]|nr:MAG: aldehyde dehydrogenase family protein [Planctomycetota bacterium]